MAIAWNRGLVASANQGAFVEDLNKSVLFLGDNGSCSHEIVPVRKRRSKITS